MDPLISIVIPVFNREKLIRDCLLSCVTQSYPNIEIIIVDDGSTDQSRHIIREIMDQHGSSIPFTYVYQDNQGPSGARNTGISRAAGEFLRFLDSDDLIPPDALKTGMKIFDQYPDTDVAFGDLLRIHLDTAEHLYKRSYPNLHELENNPVLFVVSSAFNTGTLLFRKECFAETSFNTGLYMREDHELCVRLAVKGFTFRYVKAVLHYYRQPSENSITAITWIENDPLRYIRPIEIIFGHVRHLDSDTVALIAERLALSLWRTGRMLFAFGMRDAASVYFNRALSINYNKLPKSVFYQAVSRIFGIETIESIRLWYHDLRDKTRTPALAVRFIKE